MTNKFILFLQLWLCCILLHAQSYKKTLAKQMIVPGIIAAYGLTTFHGNGFPSSYEVKKYHDQHYANFHTRIDDALPFVPVALTYGLDLLGVKCKSDFTNRSIIFAKATVISLACVNILKYSTHVLRPDSSAANSFPSGHTAFAFAMATVMDRELRDESVWWSVLGYGCATGVGALRMLNNRHWLSDVLVGAGIGIASGQIAATTHRYKWRKILLRADVSPVIYKNGYGIALRKTF